MICGHCNKEFPNIVVINGKKYGLYSRKYCLDCSPFKSGQRTRVSKVVFNETQTKICGACKTELPFTNFYIRKDKKRYGELQSQCKKCTHKRVLDRQRNIKRLCIEYKGGKCVKCGVKDHPSIYDFHHLDSTKKDFKISSWKAYSFEKIKPELDKCDLLCANCHRKTHHNY